MEPCPETYARKICKIMDMATELGAPVIEVERFGRRTYSRRSSFLGGIRRDIPPELVGFARDPQISAIMGPCAGGAVYSPALTDFIFMVKQTSYMFITGPEVVKSVTQEEVTMENLGFQAYSTRSGVSIARRITIWIVS